MQQPPIDISVALTDLLPKVWGFAWRLTCDKRDAEDLVQRTCVRVLEKQQQFRDGSSFHSWVFTITHSIWKNEIRSRQTRPVSLVDETTTENVEDVSQANAEQKIQLMQILQCIEALPEDQRAAILLVAVEGFSYKESAKILDIPIGTVMSRLARARQRICERTTL